jgi:dTDP-4-dehydrorhamnose reductase
MSAHWFPTEAAEGLRGRRVLLTGAGGMLGRAFVEALAPLGDSVQLTALAHEQLDVTDRHAVDRCAALEPDIILHCAGLVIAERCERESDLAHAVHVEGTRNVARLARATGARVFYPQSFLIFDGHEVPAGERTEPRPEHVYGRVKLAAERLLLDGLPGTLVVRLGGFFGGDDRDKNFVGQLTRTFDRLLADGVRSYAVGDRIWQPTYTLDLARNILLLLGRGHDGIYHMSCHGEASFFDVATACVHSLGLDQRIRIVPVDSSAFDAQERARRPHRLVLGTSRLDREGLDRQRPWREALHEYLGRPWFDRLRAPEECRT